MFFLKNKCDLKLVMLLKVVLFFVMISCDMFAGSADAIQLDGVTTKKPRITKYSKTNSSLSTISTPARPKTSETFRVVASNGATCILLKADALISISYTTLTGEIVETDLYIPDDAKVQGDCRNEDDESMSISFKGFTMEWYFAKTPGGERWYVDSIRLVYNASLAKFEHSRVRGRVQLGTGARRALLFPTPVGKSYSCSRRETKVELDNLDLESYVGHNSTLYLREFQLQAFMYKAGNSFGPEFECSAGGSVRSEAAPVAVGATLAVAVLFTVVGYSIWRYVTVKKVHYDTME